MAENADPAEESVSHLLLSRSYRKISRVADCTLTNPEQAWLKHMAVDKDVSGRGHGGRVLQALEADTRPAKSPENRPKCSRKRHAIPTFGTITQ